MTKYPSSLYILDCFYFSIIMYLIRSSIVILAFLFTMHIFQSSVMAMALSNNVKEHIKYLLDMIGIDNEYTRFLSYLKIYPPETNEPMTMLYNDLFSLDAYTTDLIQAYGKYYTLDDVKSLLEFYSSPLGKKTLQMNHELNKQMEDIMLNKISDYIFTAADQGYDISLPQIAK
jgi:hypothetical protein